MQTDYSHSGKRKLSIYIELALMVIVFALLLQVGLRKHNGHPTTNSTLIKGAVNVVDIKRTGH